MAEAFRAGAGGISGLAHFLREHGEAIEWDMAHYWPGRSLMELYRGEMSWRELRVFLRYLPQDSATARAMDPDNAWTREQHLLALLGDQASFLSALTVYVNSDPKKRGQFRAPDPIERPGVQSRAKSNVIRFGGRHGSGAAQLAGLFGGPAS